MSTSDLPLLNAALNALSTLFIATGWWLILTERKRAHIVCMVAALVTSLAFLISYVTYHVLKQGVVTRFLWPGWPSLIYFPLLISHLILAIVILPMVILTVIPALRCRFDRHRRIGRWTMPIWLYVSVTGVLVYLMLYVWFPGRPAA